MDGLNDGLEIDIEGCGRCGGSARVIASIEYRGTVDRIPDHLRQKERVTPTRPLLEPPTRAPTGMLRQSRKSKRQAP